MHTTRTTAQLVTAAMAGLVLAASCSYPVEIRPAPSYDAYAFETALPVAAAVYVDADQLSREVRVTPSGDGSGLCGDSRYPLDAREPVALSVVDTLERLVREVHPRLAPPDRAAMEAEGLDAVIVVRADSLNVGVTGGLGPGFEAGADLTLSVSAFTRDGLQLREFVFGNGVRIVEGRTCAAGAEALGLAVETAMENAMTELGELIVNSPELRLSLAGAGSN